MKKLILPRLIAKAHISGYMNSHGTYVAPHEDKRVKRKDDHDGWLGADMADAIRDHMESDPYATFGLRVIPHGHEVGVGDELPPSKRWEDGEDTGEELDGTSTIGVTKKNVEQAIKTLERAGYSGSQIVLVAGESAGYGEDEGERLISDAKVIAAWRRSPTMQKSLVIVRADMVKA